MTVGGCAFAMFPEGLRMSSVPSLVCCLAGPGALCGISSQKLSSASHLLVASLG